MEIPGEHVSYETIAEDHRRSQQALEAAARAGVGGIARLQLIARLTPNLSREDHEELFPRIAGDDKSPPDSEAVRVVVESYIGFALGAAFRAFRLNPDVELENLVGASMEALVKGVYTFAEGGDYRSFPNYMTPVLRDAMSTEIMHHRYDLSGDRGAGWKQAELRRYLRAKRELEGDDIDTVSSRDVADAISITPQTAAMLETLGKRLLLYDGCEETLNYQPYIPPPPEYSEHSSKKILVERAMLLLTDTQADIIDKYFGITGVQYTIDELARERSVDNQIIRTEVYKAKQLLREIITKMQTDTFDFVAWRQSHQSCRNVLTFLAILGVPIPPNAPLTELRAIALQHLPNTSKIQETRQILAELYGLRDGIPKKGKELAETTGIGIDTIYHRDRRFMNEHGVTTAKGSRTKPLEEK